MNTTKGVIAISDLVKVSDISNITQSIATIVYVTPDLPVAFEPDFRLNIVMLTSEDGNYQRLGISHRPSLRSDMHQLQTLMKICGVKRNLLKLMSKQVTVIFGSCNGEHVPLAIGTSDEENPIFYLTFESSGELYTKDEVMKKINNL